MEKVIVSSDQAGKRLDQVLSNDMSRNHAQKLITGEFVQVNDVLVTTAKYKLKQDDVITYTDMPVQALDLTPVDLNLDVIFEDDHLIVLNKPAGMVVHPSVGHETDTLVHGLLYHCKGQLSGINGIERPGIVHRLDKDTSGLMVTAKTDTAHNFLSNQFADRSLSRQYICICHGQVMPTQGLVDAPIGRSTKDRKKMAVVSSGREAQTSYKVIHYDAEKDLSTVICKLHTGRTHQVRVHMQHLGFPLIGDPVYGKRRKTGSAIVDTFGRQALHAFHLEFIHPQTDEVMTFDCPLPIDMQPFVGNTNCRTIFNHS